MVCNTIQTVGEVHNVGLILDIVPTVEEAQVAIYKDEIKLKG